MTDLDRARAHLHAAIDALERIALDFPSAGRGIERVLGMNLAPARDALDALIEEASA